MSTRYFGTDGIRGPADGPLFDQEFLHRLTGAVIGFIRAGHGTTAPRIVIGRDTRESGGRILGHLAAGFSRFPGECIDLGIVPTPAVAWVTRSEEADLGISLTASHNPSDDNGIKLFSREGVKFEAIDEERIEALMLQPPAGSEGAHPGFTLLRRPASAGYLRSVEVLSKHLDLAGLTIVCDTANGAACATTPDVLRDRGAEVITIAAEPDGSNINLGCGSEHPEAMARRVKETGAALGIAHDGDGDRVVFADENAEIVPGDQILGIFALHGIRKESLAGRVLVATVQSNRGLDLAVAKAGGSVVRTDVGDRNVAARMRALGASLGGESSGHIILHNYSTTGDGLLAVLYLLRVMKETGRTLSDLRSDIPLLPQRNANLAVKEKIPLSECRALARTQAAVKKEIGGGGRVMIRYSGTEPKLRFLVETSTLEECAEKMDRLLAAARADLPVA
ncbi:MAG: phosphoglucosamine mutase [Puniceicoccaceae bacterium]